MASWHYSDFPHGRPGFYFRVLQEGEVEAGDEIFKVAEGPERMSVVEINELLYLPGHPRPKLERALRIPALSAGWQKSFQALLQPEPKSPASGNPGLTSAGGPPPAWPGFRRLRVSRIAWECDNVFSLELTSADDRSLAIASPGQFVVVRLHPQPEGPSLLRSYSLSGAPSNECYRLGIKHEPRGIASNYMATRLKVGDTVEVSAPRGSFVLRANHRPVVLLSAGIGITPVLAMLHALATEASQRTVWWFHGARNGNENPFAEEARVLLKRLPHSRSYVQYSKPNPAEQPGVHFDAPGHLEMAMLEQLGVSKEADFYLCGPTAFLRDFAAGLTAWGVAHERVFTEIFGPGGTVAPGVVHALVRSPRTLAGGSDKGPRVAFARSGVEVSWDPAFNSLLELAEACDVPVRWSCRTGVCHTCETALIAGTVHYDPDPVEPPAGGNLLICCSRPQGDVIIDL